MGVDRTMASHGTGARPRLPVEAQAEQARCLSLVRLLQDEALLMVERDSHPFTRAAGELLSTWLAEVGTVIRSGGDAAELVRVRGERIAKAKEGA